MFLKGGGVRGAKRARGAREARRAAKAMWSMGRASTMHAKQEEAIALVQSTPGAGAGVEERSLEVPREVLVKEESEDAAAGERLVRPNVGVHRERRRP